MQKRILSLVMMVSLCLGAVVAQAEGLGVTSAKFIMAYNSADSERTFTKLPIVNYFDITREEGAVKDAANVKLTPYSSVVLTFDKESLDIAEAMFLGSGDGTPGSGQIIMASAFAFLHGILEKHDKKRILLIFKAIISSKISEGENFNTTVGNIKISASISDTLGFTITASPAGKSTKESSELGTQKFLGQYIKEYNKYAQHTKRKTISTPKIEKESNKNLNIDIVQVTKNAHLRLNSDKESGKLKSVIYIRNMDDEDEADALNLFMCLFDALIHPINKELRKQVEYSLFDSNIHQKEKRNTTAGNIKFSTEYNPLWGLVITASYF